MAAVFPNIFDPGFRLEDGSQLNAAFALPQVSSEASITATGTNQATAYQLSAAINDVTTAASGTGVKLPRGRAGRIITVFNDGANALQVYSFDTATIDGTAGATGVTLTNAKRCAYYAISEGVWISAQLGVVSA